MPSYLTKISFDHVILGDRQGILVLLPTIGGYTLWAIYRLILYTFFLTCQINKNVLVLLINTGLIYHWGYGPRIGVSLGVKT